MAPETLSLILAGGLPKGDVLGTARIAGVMAAKRCANLIPLCHPLRISSVEVDFSADEPLGLLRIEATVRAHDRTGVEMEALTAVSVAGLTVYDMCKAVDRDMVLSGIRLTRKTGERAGISFWKESNRFSYVFIFGDHAPDSLPPFARRRGDMS